MTLMELGALGEFVGSVAVLATLVYLAIQVRHARQEVRRAALGAWTENVRDTWINRISNSELLDAIVKADSALGSIFMDLPYTRMLIDEGGLSPREAYMLLADEIIQWQGWCSMIADRANQTPDRIGRMNRSIRSYYSSGRSRKFWEMQCDSNVEQEAIAYIRGVLDE